MWVMQGPLDGLRIIEIAGRGPGPFAGMMLSDMGADVIRVDRVATGEDGLAGQYLGRGRRSIALDLKRSKAVDILLSLVASADVLYEGFRPGVAERLGFGPAACLAQNPRLIYGRVTGWGQDGPLAPRAGHAIDFIAVSGALATIGSAGGPPVPPVNYLGDYAGGGMMLAFGLLCALYERSRSGRGQVVDAAMLDGAVLLTTNLHWRLAQGAWTERRGENSLDSGSPFYRVYQTLDGEHVAVGAVEQRFRDTLLDTLGVSVADLADQAEQESWPTIGQRLAAAFTKRTRDEWTAVFADKDACVAPVLRPSEVAANLHVRDRGTVTSVDGVQQPAPAPRFSRTPGSVVRNPPRPGEHSDAILTETGLSDAEIKGLRRDGVVG
jgi:alpha-methylacyl-CoA racemase